MKTRLALGASLLAILVGLLWLASAAGDLVQQSGLLRDEFLIGFVAVPMYASFVLMLFAVIGTRQRYQAVSSPPGRLGLGLSLIGCAGLIVALLGSILLGTTAPDLAQGSWVNVSALACFLAVHSGYILFGVDALRLRLLPRWNLAPLLLGSSAVLGFTSSWFGVPSFLPQEWALPSLHLAVTGLCWLMLGFSMMEPRHSSRTTPAA